MLVPNFLFGEKMPLLTETDYENCPEHVDLKKRLRKTLYYGKMPTIDRPSLAMTELAVELLQDLAPKEFGKVDMYWASDLTREACTSPCSFVLAMLYVKRLKKKDSLYLNQVSSSDLLLVAMMVASKFLYDEGEMEEALNEEWARSANIDVDEMNALERSFLAAIDWNLFVSKTEFWSALNAWEKEIAWRRVKERDANFTYTDLFVLTDARNLSAEIHAVLHQICEIVMVCLVSYSACLVPVILSPLALCTLQSFASTSFTLSQGLITVSPFDLDLQSSVSVLLSRTGVLPLDEVKMENDSLEGGYQFTSGLARRLEADTGELSRGGQDPRIASSGSLMAFVSDGLGVSSGFEVRFEGLNVQLSNGKGASDSDYISRVPISDQNHELNESLRVNKNLETSGTREEFRSLKEAFESKGAGQDYHDHSEVWQEKGERLLSKDQGGVVECKVPDIAHGSCDPASTRPVNPDPVGLPRSVSLSYLLALALTCDVVQSVVRTAADWMSHSNDDDESSAEHDSSVPAQASCDSSSLNGEHCNEFCAECNLSRSPKRNATCTVERDPSISAQPSCDCHGLNVEHCYAFCAECSLSCSPKRNATCCGRHCALFRLIANMQSASVPPIVVLSHFSCCCCRLVVSDPSSLKVSAVDGQFGHSKCSELKVGGGTFEATHLGDRALIQERYKDDLFVSRGIMLTA